jgi:hypothetical protein
MKTVKNLALCLVIVSAILFIFQGCEFLDKITGKSKPAEPTGTTGTTGTTESSGGAGTTETNPPEEQPLAKITNIADNATGIDTKLPLEWWVDEKAGKVTMMGVNFFECGADGKELPNAVIAFKNLMDEKMCAMRKWTLFGEDVDKNWLFQGTHADMKELKANTKYLMTFMIGTEGGQNETVRLYFTTK